MAERARTAPSPPRRRAFAAVLVVLLVVVAATGWWVVHGRELGGPGLYVRVSGPMSVWPETPLDDPGALEVAQARIGSGAGRWRLSAKGVTVRFVKNVLGWPGIVIAGIQRQGRSATVITVVRCAQGDGCPRRDPGSVDPASTISERIALGQLGRRGSGGVWSVVAVASPRLTLPQEAGAVMSDGSTVHVGLAIDPDEHAAVGLAWDGRTGAPSGTACERGFAGEAGIAAGGTDLVVPGVSDDGSGCAGAVGAGYVFAYATPALTVQTGDPLLESASITDLTMVPVAFTTSPSPSPTTTAS